MSMLRRINVSVLGVLFTVAPLRASALEKVFKSLGSDVNLTQGGSYNDQAAGHYTGGGMMVRHKSAVFQPIQVSLPRIGVGCNGIDMYGGSMSFFKADEFSKFLRSMAEAAPTYALQLALKTMAPQIETLLASLRKAAMDMNATMLDSCQMSQQLVGGLWPKNSAASEQICQDVKRQKEHGGLDYFGARKHCASSDTANMVAEAKKDEANKDLLQGEYNLTWKIATEKLGLDPILATFAMTTLGTIVSVKEGNQYRLTYIKGMADSEEYIQAHVKGGKTRQKTCGEEQVKCLQVSETTLDILKEDTLQNRFATSLYKLLDHYMEDTTAPADAMSLIKDETGLPLYTYIQVAAATGSRFILADAIEYMSIMVLAKHMEKTAFEVEKALEALQGVQLTDDVIVHFKANIRALRKNLQRLQLSLSSDSVWRFNEMIKGFENMVVAKENL